jgi:predicted glycoside hydrolase/deacetylase ChbG (UPF0249 family)
MRKYIITRDDCGLSEGINHATLARLEQGLPVSPSIMTLDVADIQLVQLRHEGRASWKVKAELNCSR